MHGWFHRPPGIYTGRLVLKKTVFLRGASTLNMGLINKGSYGMVCRLWDMVFLIDDVSSVSPSSEQTWNLPLKYSAVSPHFTIQTF